MKYSLIVPVYNRPDEVAELLESLAALGRNDFEVIVVEDGSEQTCQDVCSSYAGRLDLHYHAKENSGPGQSRNYGAERAKGDYLIILDSDVVVPPGYLAAIDAELRRRPCDAFGGPDAAHPSFSPVQKAISYAMTSFFTTGGIRGGAAKKALDRFFPRSFNMGVRRDCYLRLGGFSRMRFGEDIDFSYRIVEAGMSCRLFPEAWVWHKRRTDLRKFFRQVYNSGIARINLEKRHPGTMKLVHVLPAAFTVGVLLLAAVALAGLVLTIAGMAAAQNPGCNMSPVVACVGLLVMAAALSPLALYSLLILADSTLKNRSLRVGLLSVPAAFVQLGGYGLGFIQAWWRRCVRGKDEYHAFEKTFYK